MVANEKSGNYDGPGLIESTVFNTTGRKVKMKSVLTSMLVVIATIGVASADISYTTSGTTYTQNFDSFGSSGLGGTWTNDSTVAGWFSNRTSYLGGTGSSATGGLYSFGTTVGAGAERAMGSLGSSSAADIRYGVRFTNNTGKAMTEFTVTYDGEQWRNGGNTTAHKLDFSYVIGTNPTTTSAGFIDVNALDFTGPIATSTAGALNGNLAANRTAGITATVTGIFWAPGQQLLLRWQDVDDTGSDHALAIDNFSFIAIPEPSSCLLLALAALALVPVYRRR